jgi:hypothetical protein
MQGPLVSTAFDGSRLPIVLRRSHCQAGTHAHTHRLVRPPTHTHTHSLTHTLTHTDSGAHTHRVKHTRTHTPTHTESLAHTQQRTRAHPSCGARLLSVARARAFIRDWRGPAGGSGACYGQAGMGMGLAAATGRCRHGLHRRAQPHPVGRALPADPRRYGRLQIRRAPTVPAPRTSAVRTFAGTRGLCMRTTRARGRQVVTHMQFERSTVGKRMLCLRLAS